jgi:Sporulation and spore germination
VSARRRWFAAALAALASGGVTLAACGTSSEDSPRLVAEDELQFDLGETVTTAGTTSTSSSPTTRPVGTLPAPATQPVTIYLVNEDDLLVPIQRELRAPPDLTTVLGALLSGPNPLEEAVGLRSTLPPGAVARVNVARGVAEVALAPDLFDEILTRDQVLAFAQLVLTLTAQPGIGQVMFTSAGEDISGQKGDGSLARPGTPLTREDYVELIEGYEPPVTTTSPTSTSSTAPRPAATTTTTTTLVP